jgi:type IV pilus assembly protein PilE
MTACTERPPSSARSMARPCTRGLTVLDLLISLALVGVLAAVAMPSYTAPLTQARRADALAAALQLQQLQERWLLQHGRYAREAELGAALVSPQGHYRLELHDVGPGGYRLSAVAQGRQSGDLECRVMHLRVRQGQVLFGDGVSTGDEASRQRRCWRV